MKIKEMKSEARRARVEARNNKNTAIYGLRSGSIDTKEIISNIQEMDLNMTKAENFEALAQAGIAEIVDYIATHPGCTETQVVNGCRGLVSAQGLRMANSWAVDREFKGEGSGSCYGMRMNLRTRTRTMVEVDSLGNIIPNSEETFVTTERVCVPAEVTPYKG